LILAPKVSKANIQIKGRDFHPSFSALFPTCMSICPKASAVPTQDVQVK
jgi:hypothetical protein